MALRKRGVTFLNLFNLLQKEEGTHKKGGRPSKKGWFQPCKCVQFICSKNEIKQILLLLFNVFFY